MSFCPAVSVTLVGEESHPKISIKSSFGSMFASVGSAFDGEIVSFFCAKKLG